jgi:thiamine-phosphate pyrophosphorylase
LKALTDCRLYAFIDTAYLVGKAPAHIAKGLCNGGADLIQLRAKDRSREEIKALASEILPITRASGVGLVINDHLSIAQEIGAEACHLGQEDFFSRGYSHVSQIRGPNSRTYIGLSTHGTHQAHAAIDAGADYIAIGPVHATETKPTAKPVTLEYVRWAAANVKIPWFAIGGINLDNLDSVLAAGANRICIVSAILKSNDIAKTCRAFKNRLVGKG